LRYRRGLKTKGFFTRLQTAQLGPRRVGGFERRA